MFKCGPIYDANLAAKEDIIVNQGGTYSGKTYGLMQVLNTIAVSERNKIITVVGESVPNLKKGAMRDNDKIVASSEILQSLITGGNKQERTITFGSGTIIEFTSYVTSQDAHSGKRDYLFINEAPGIPWAIAEQLINRTNTRTYIDYNPSIPFWSHEKLINPGKFGAKKVKTIISDHRHNPFLTQEQHDHIEMRALQDPEWGKVYARGLTGKVEGLILRNWQIVDAIGTSAKLIANGLDFGFTNDPSASVAVYMQDGELWVDELLYETGLTNDKIADELKKYHGNFVCDSSEPKSIQELKNHKLKAVPAEKGPGSVNTSIDILKRYKINVTRRSVNLIKELNRYKWRVDKTTGANLNEPVDFYNHLIDALRYVGLNYLQHKDRSFGYSVVRL